MYPVSQLGVIPGCCWLGGLSLLKGRKSTSIRVTLFMAHSADGGTLLEHFVENRTLKLSMFLPALDRQGTTDTSGFFGSDR